jgi:hypothetical protein
MTDSSSLDTREIADEEAVNAIVARGPAGAFAVAGIATAIVVALYFAFYVFAYLPRGVML